MSLEAQPQNQQPEEIKTLAENDTARTEGGVSEQGVGSSLDIPKEQGGEEAHIKYPEDLSEVKHRLQPVTSPADLYREPKLLPEKKWYEKGTTKVAAGVATVALLLTGGYLAGRNGQSQDEKTTPRPTTSAPANPGIVPAPANTATPTSGEATSNPNQPVTPEDVKQQAESMTLSPELYSPELIKSLVTPEDNPRLTEIRTSYPNYAETLNSQVQAFLDNASVDLVHNTQKAYLDMMQQGATYNPVELEKGNPVQMTTVEFFGMLTNSGIKQFPAEFPSTDEIKDFAPNADAKDVSTYVGVSARNASLNDQVTTWVARNEQGILAYNKVHDPTQKLPQQVLNLDAFISLGIADPNGAFGSQVIPERERGFLANPYDAVNQFDAKGGFIVDALTKKDKLGPNPVDIQGFTAVYNRVQNGKDVPVMGTFMMVPLEKAIVDGKLVDKKIVVPVMVWQSDLLAK